LELKLTQAGNLISATTLNALNPATGDAYDLVAVMGGEPDVMFDKGIAELGGMQKFVKPGQTVVVKPNIGWDKPLKKVPIPIPFWLNALSNIALMQVQKKYLFLIIPAINGPVVIKTVALKML
jgi:hypothetical protein